MRTLAFGIVLLAVSNAIYGQSIANPTKDHPPLDIPLVLSGNFAELRTGHFHSGLDFKTQGVIGKRVYSIAEGYISRIKVQSIGYGKSLYISHPDGRTSVYGHLDRYIPAIDRYVKAFQYRNQTHELDIYPTKEDFPLKAGELIGYSGNTGSSAGPHLHFEIRNTHTQEPVNALKNGFTIGDNIPPKINAVFLYNYSSSGTGRLPLARKEFALDQTGDTAVLKHKGPVLVRGCIGIGIETWDILDGAPNHCGIYSIKLFAAGELIYHFLADHFNFNETRYLNAHTDYSLGITNKRKTHNLFVKPNEKLSMNKHALNSGLIDVEPGESYPVVIEIKDVHNNSRVVVFKLEGSGTSSVLRLSGETDEKTVFRWKEDNYFTNHALELKVPAYSLYEDTRFTYTKKPRAHQTFPVVHSIHTPEVPLHIPAELKIAPDSVSPSMLAKTAIYLLDKDDKPVFVGGEYKQGRIVSRISEFGRFILETDSIAPVIRPVNHTSGADLSKSTSIRFQLEDNLSGISEYQGYIDNKWALFEYDSKNSLLFYEFDKERLTHGLLHELELYIRDKAGNTSIFHSTFLW
jgi:murein DD-endopeptidase MepM/ murein hydrolase activator NlpD